MVMLWQSLRYDQESGVANVAEATSYATRSELARRLIVQFDSLRSLARLWASSGGDDGSGAGAEAPLDLIRFEGVEAVAWSGDDGTRFLANGDNPAFTHEPSAAEWAPLEAIVIEAQTVTAETARGPFVDADGHAVFHYLLPAAGVQRRGVLVAVIDAHDLLEALLVDEAIGYAIRVSCCDGIELYRRGSADEQLPGSWTRDGWIAPAAGIRWNVRHRPTEALAEDLRTAAVDSVLVVGIVLALLLGGLVFETRRANDRAAAARDAERRIRGLNRELEDRVLARTQKLDDVLTELNTINLSVSHDLRSPLNAISLMVGQLHATNADAAAAGRYERIEANIKRMAGIMDRLLSYSRASALGSEVEEVDMRALAEQVFREQSLRPEAAQFGELPPTRADRVVAHILLTNLVANAVKHARVGRALRIEIGSRQAPDGVTAYYVRDNGRGLEAGLAERLFKPLERDSPAADTGSDLGLGLAIAARAVERHGGRIWVESEPGRGATFLFTLHAPPTDDEDD